MELNFDLSPWRYSKDKLKQSTHYRDFMHSTRVTSHYGMCGKVNIVAVKFTNRLLGIELANVRHCRHYNNNYYVSIIQKLAP